MTPPVWQAHPSEHLTALHVLVAPASLIGSELSSLLGSDPSLFPTPIRYAATKTTRVGVILRGVRAFIMRVLAAVFFLHY
jgi:hypothetical protein